MPNSELGNASNFLKTIFQKRCLFRKCWEGCRQLSCCLLPVLGFQEPQLPLSPQRAKVAPSSVCEVLLLQRRAQTLPDSFRKENTISSGTKL